MTIKTVRVSIYHTLELDIPDELLDEDSWDLSSFIYDAFMDNEDGWDDFNIEYIKDVGIND